MPFKPPFIAPFDSEGALPVIVRRELDTTGFDGDSKSADATAGQIIDALSGDITTFVNQQRLNTQNGVINVRKSFVVFPGLHVDYSYIYGQEIVRLIVSPQSVVPEEEQPEVQPQEIPQITPPEIVPLEVTPQAWLYTITFPLGLAVEFAAKGL